MAEICCSLAAVCGFARSRPTAKQAPVGVLMDEANQGFCVLAGGADFIRDSILAAMLAKNQIFPSLNLLVVPVDMGGGDGAGGKGFGKPLSYEEEGYVAAPADVSFCSFSVFRAVFEVSFFRSVDGLTELQQKWVMFHTNSLHPRKFGVSSQAVVVRVRVLSKLLVGKV